MRQEETESECRVPEDYGTLKPGRGAVRLSLSLGSGKRPCGVCKREEEGGKDQLLEEEREEDTEGVRERKRARDGVERERDIQRM